MAVDRPDRRRLPFTWATLSSAVLGIRAHWIFWTRNALSAFAEVRATGEVLDVEPSFGAFGGLFESAGFTVLDAGVSWRFAAWHRGLRARDEPSLSS